MDLKLPPLQIVQPEVTIRFTKNFSNSAKKLFVSPSQLKVIRMRHNIREPRKEIQKFIKTLNPKKQVTLRFPIKAVSDQNLKQTQTKKKTRKILKPKPKIHKHTPSIINQPPYFFIQNSVSVARQEFVQEEQPKLPFIPPPPVKLPKFNYKFVIEES